MPRPSKLDITESLDELKTLLEQQKSAQGKERVQALYLLKRDEVKTVTDLAQWLGRHRVTVQAWLAHYRQGGMAQLLRQVPPTGRPASIPPWAVAALKQRLQDPKGFCSYGAVQQWLQDTLGVTASYQAVYELVRFKLKAKLKVVKRQSQEQDPEVLQQFKQDLAGNVSLLKAVCEQRLGTSAQRLRYWCQDENRWSLTTVCRRLLTALGVKPVGTMQWQCEGFWLCGPVEPLKGDCFFYKFSHLDSVCFERFLNEVAQHYPEECHILQLDRASAHTAKRVHPPENIVLMFQPSHCPELNPIERLWKHLKDQFSWVLFEDLEALRLQV